MFRPNEDRVEYGAELMPPPGWHLVRAVATTYSLDFETLIAALIPLGLGGDIDDKEMHNPISIMQAIRRVADKLVIFCEGGQVKCPTSTSRLITLLDDVIVQVALPMKGKSYPSFHPKTWTLEFAQDDAPSERMWRFVVLSRNLSSDHSWDVSVSLDGFSRRGAYSKTQKVVAFLEFLRGRVNKGAGNDRLKAIVEKMIRSLDGVSFFCDHPFADFDILPFGIGDKEEDLFKIGRPFCDRVVISPFVSPELIRELNEDGRSSESKRRILISRGDALGKLSQEDADRFTKYVLRQTMYEDGSQCDLHAKVYLWRYGSDTEICLGSVNATKSGIHRNVEMMVRLNCKNRYLNAGSLLEEICGGDPGGKTSPLEEVPDVARFAVEESVEEKARHEAENKIRRVCRLKIQAEVRKAAERFRVVLHVPEMSMPEGVDVWPINAKGNRLSNLAGGDVEFREPMDLVDLSSLFVFETAYDGGSVTRVIKVPTDGIPAGRNDAVLNEIVKDRSALLRYLALLFSSCPALTLREIEDAQRCAAGIGRDGAPVLPGLYEEMLKAASEDPARIREAGHIMSRLKGDDALLTAYRKLYLTFAEALGLPREKTHG